MAATIRKVIRDLDPAVPLQVSGPWTSQLEMSLIPSQMATVALGRMLILLAGGSVVGMLLGVATSQVLSAIVYQAATSSELPTGLVLLTSDAL